MEFKSPTTTTTTDEVNGVAVGFLPLASDSQQPYVSGLLSFTLDRLHKEPELLRVNAERIQRQMQEVVVANYRAFISVADALLSIREEVFSIDKHLRSEVRVANELGAGNANGAKFATIVAVTTSTIIGIFFWLLIMIFHNELALIFSSSKEVLEAVNTLSILLAFTILLNSVQPILSGVAVGSGWQSYVAYINIGCYYFIGVPLGIAMGWIFNLGVMGIWAGMIFGGTAIQTLILAVITIRCDWEKEAQRASMHVKKWGDMN